MRPRLAPSLLVVLLGPIVTGCPSPNTYGTPRTIPKGKVSHTASAEAIGYRSGRSTGVEPVVPSYTLRGGVGERVDIGLRVANLASIALDAKVNLLRSRTLDLAVAPGGQWFSVGPSNLEGGGSTAASVNVFYLHAPLLAGLNLSATSTLLLTAGITQAARTGAAFPLDDDRIESVVAVSRTLARLGLGVQARVTPTLAVQPEVTALQAIAGENALMYMMGVGFIIGKQPDYSDLE